MDHLNYDVNIFRMHETHLSILVKDLINNSLTLTALLYRYCWRYLRTKENVYGESFRSHCLEQQTPPIDYSLKAAPYEEELEGDWLASQTPVVGMFLGMA